MQPTPETYNEWQQAYNLINSELFNGTLPDCLITFQREKNTMGYFSHHRFASSEGKKTDEIAINPAYFASCGLNEALQTLGHEMVHLWQQHFGDPGRGRYHNKEWANKMESIGLMPSSTGEPGGKKTGDHVSDYIIDGGCFQKTIKLLVKKGFALKWMDRYVASSLPAATSLSDSATDDEIVQAIGISSELANAIEPDYARFTQKQGNRSKYTCPYCSVNIWGKPGLNINCGDCNKPFEES